MCAQNTPTSGWSRMCVQRQGLRGHRTAKSDPLKLETLNVRVHQAPPGILMLQKSEDHSSCSNLSFFIRETEALKVEGSGLWHQPGHGVSSQVSWDIIQHSFQWVIFKGAGNLKALLPFVQKIKHKLRESTIKPNKIYNRNINKTMKQIKFK